MSAIRWKPAFVTAYDSVHPPVTHRVPRGELAGAATDVEQQSSPATDHVGDDALGQQQLRGDVAEHATSQLVGFGLEEPGPPPGADVDRVVDEHVQVTQAHDGGVDRRCERVRVEQVERDGDGTTTALLDGRGGRVETARQRRVGVGLEGGGVAVVHRSCGDRHVEADLGETEGDARVRCPGWRL